MSRKYFTMSLVTMLCCAVLTVSVFHVANNKTVETPSADAAVVDVPSYVLKSGGRFNPPSDTTPVLWTVENLDSTVKTMTNALEKNLEDEYATLTADYIEYLESIRNDVINGAEYYYYVKSN